MAGNVSLASFQSLYSEQGSASIHIRSIVPASMIFHERCSRIRADETECFVLLLLDVDRV